MITLAYSTFASNSAAGGAGSPVGGSFGGSIATTNGTLRLDSCILANPRSSSNSFGPLTDSGHNLSSDTSCNFSGPGSLNAVDCKLGPLGDYGGPAPTIPLLAGSPALDAGDAPLCPSTDQRGRPRPFGAGCDIGAFESSPPYVILGHVSGLPLSDQVAITAAGTTTATTNRGTFRLDGLAHGTYSLNPAHSNYVFIPALQQITVGPDRLGVEFKAYRWNSLTVSDLSNNVVHLIYAGTNGETHRVLASTDLIDWSAVATNMVGNGNFFEFSEPVVTTNRLQVYQTVRP
jgi:hypothetical protein